MSVQKSLEYSTGDQGTVESYQSTKGHASHYLSSQKSRGLYLFFSKRFSSMFTTLHRNLWNFFISLKCSRIFSPLYGDFSLCKSDVRTIKPLLYYKGSKGKSSCKKKKYLALLPLGQRHLKISTSK